MRRWLWPLQEWDKWHREDIALMRAIKQSPLAEEMYSVCSTMDAMFHMGDGKLFLRAASAAVGTPTKGGRLPPITRKAVGLASEPGSLLKNFPVYVAGLHAREQWRKDGVAWWVCVWVGRGGGGRTHYNKISWAGWGRRAPADTQQQ